ncbi:HlyD family efflux transporter periplasmic adaptor subunit [Lewinella lacunae]|uniref:HlyD family efflux transporter periplasmic adaptor subunit n=1 Tax=Neolewinella lacunae TaxID=1517758 RepID=A0A923PHU6_9BACT|nr:HlyD family efflux transporter periplasmic adaptor subunit [Neolewinella lacunae]
MNLTALESVDLPTGQGMFRRWILAAIIFFFVVLFLPWTQNFRAKGTVTAFDPANRPQTIHATIPGRVEEWFVFEGDTISAGDTIARLSEIKPEYLDPNLVDRTATTREAKSNSAEGYLAKAAALSDQINSLRQEQALKLKQSINKLSQSRLYVVTLEAELAQQEVEVSIAEYQLRRADSLYQSGLKPLTDLEAKRLKQQEALAKLTTINNKLDQARTEVTQTELAIQSVGPEYANKLAKAESDRQSALTEYYNGVGEVAKLENQEANYRIRRGYNFIVAPQDGILARILTPGLGETIKEGEPIASILPARFEAAVEMYVDPFNLPLVAPGRTVRFLFDGWPAVFFSGWPGLSYGTFVGEVVAIDNIIDAKGRYRVLVKPTSEGRPWPEALRPGSGAEGVVLLANVPVWYELWRQLNAFPPDYYQTQQERKAEEESVKLKAPVKDIIK